MDFTASFLGLSPTVLAEILSRENIMHRSIHGLWPNMPRIAGPAYPVRCGLGDNLMLHAAIYRAPRGAVIVCQAGDDDYAVAGGNVCAIAQKNGIAGFVIDGVVRDIAEIRANHFPVYARGLMPIPASKNAVGVMNSPIQCGGVDVRPGDMIVADEEGVVVVPWARLEEVLTKALDKAAREAADGLDVWAANHKKNVEDIMSAKGLADHLSIP
ncbi:MAG: RraA family protein [Chitinophagaceae bacterium]|nr:RraA family protein [Oligoflexus sp.]